MARWVAHGEKGSDDCDGVARRGDTTAAPVSATLVLSGVTFGVRFPSV
jgi:hypothetical protein